MTPIYQITADFIYDHHNNLSYPWFILQRLNTDAPDYEDKLRYISLL